MSASSCPGDLTEAERLSLLARLHDALDNLDDDFLPEPFRPGPAGSLVFRVLDLRRLLHYALDQGGYHSASHRAYLIGKADRGDRLLPRTLEELFWVLGFDEEPPNRRDLGEAYLSSFRGKAQP